MSKISFEQGKKIEKIIEESVYENRDRELCGVEKATNNLIKFIEEEIINE